MTPTTPPETCELQDPQEAASTTRPAGPVHAPLRTEIGGTGRPLAPPAGAAGRLGAAARTGTATLRRGFSRIGPQSNPNRHDVPEGEPRPR